MKKGNIAPGFQWRAFSFSSIGFRDDIFFFLLFVVNDTLATAARIPATTRTNILMSDVGRLKVCSVEGGRTHFLNNTYSKLRDWLK